MYNRGMENNQPTCPNCGTKLIAVALPGGMPVNSPTGVEMLFVEHRCPSCEGDRRDERIKGIEDGLLPCPFCGGKATYSEVSPAVSMLNYAITCVRCHVERLGSDTWTAVRRWQGRADIHFIDAKGVAELAQGDWQANGRYIDPGLAEVPLEDKLPEHVQLAFIRGFNSCLLNVASSLRRVRAVLHQLEVGEASDGENRDIKWCAAQLRKAVAMTERL